MVLLKKKAGLPPRAPASAEQTSGVAKAARANKKQQQTGKANVSADAPAVESRSDQPQTNRTRSIDAASCAGHSTSAPSISASHATDGSQRSAVRVTRSNGMKKVKRSGNSSGAAIKKSNTNGGAKKNSSGGKAHKTVASKATAVTGSSKATKAATAHSKKSGKKQNAEKKQLATKNAKKSSMGKVQRKKTKNNEPQNKEREGLEKAAAAATVAATAAAATGPNLAAKPGSILKGCKSDDKERDAAMENSNNTNGGEDKGAIDTNAEGGAIDAVGPAPTNATNLWSVGSMDMSNMQTSLTESYRSFEDGALKMKESIVFEKEFEELGKNAQQWSESTKAQCSQNIIPMGLAAGSGLIAQAIGAMGGACGALARNSDQESDTADDTKQAEVEGGENMAMEEEKNADEDDETRDIVVEAPIASQINEAPEEPQPEKKQEEQVEEVPPGAEAKNISQDDEVPLIEPITQAQHLPQKVMAMPSQLGEEVEHKKSESEPEPEPTRPPKSPKSKRWGRFHKKSKSS